MYHIVGCRPHLCVFFQGHDRTRVPQIIGVGYFQCALCCPLDLFLALTGVTVTSSTYESDNTTRRPAEGPVFSICTCVLDLLVLLLLAVVHNL